MNLRDQFAAAALPALIARHRADVAWGQIAPTAYSIADAMVAARGDQQPHASELQAILRGVQAAQLGLNLGGVQHLKLKEMEGRLRALIEGAADG